jgi:hypothetical protein
MKDDTRLALGIFAMVFLMIVGGVLGGFGIYTALILLDHTDYLIQDAGYRVLGLSLSVIGGLFCAVVSGFLLGQFFWNRCSPPETGV